MVICVDPRETFEYVLEEDREAETPTVFLLRSMPARREREVLARLSKVQTSKNADEEFSALRDEIVSEQLTGWRAMPDQSGNAVEARVEEGKLVPSCLDLLTSRWRTELFNAVLNRGRVTTSESD